jgi:ABC-type branched-subunit amino acid transport system substrate-binding protein
LRVRVLPPEHDAAAPPAAAFPRPFTRRALLAGAGAAALGACSGGRRRPALPSAAAPQGSGAGNPLVVGVITPLTGPYAYVGRMVTAALTATTRHIDADLGGSLAGYRPVVLTADAPLTAADGLKAYTHLKGLGIDAVLWAGAPGLDAVLPAIVSDLTPVIAVGTDLQGLAATDPSVPDLTSSDANGFPVFQLAVPMADAFGALAGYAATDRHLSRTGVVWSSASAGADKAWSTACAGHHLEPLVSLSFDASGGSSPDLSAAVLALRAAEVQFVVFVGAAPDAAHLVTGLDFVGGRYIDTPTAREGGFRPMVAGLAGATGTTVFASLGGPYAAKGTISVTNLGGATGLPHLPIRDWLGRFVAGYGIPRGGEDGPADAIALILTAAGAARSTAGADLVAAIEAEGALAFATPVPVGFAPDRHVAPGAGDVALLTLESTPEPRYDLGREWGEVFHTGDRTPDLLVDPTLAANRAAHPQLMGDVTAGRFGISSQASYQDGDAAKMAACTAVH